MSITDIEYKIEQLETLLAELKDDPTLDNMWFSFRYFNKKLHKDSKIREIELFDAFFIEQIIELILKDLKETLHDKRLALRVLLKEELQQLEEELGIAK